MTFFLTGELGKDQKKDGKKLPIRFRLNEFCRKSFHGCIRRRPAAQKGLTQDPLAALAGTNQAAIKRYETDRAAAPYRIDSGHHYQIHPATAPVVNVVPVNAAAKYLVRLWMGMVHKKCLAECRAFSFCYTLQKRGNRCTGWSAFFWRVFQRILRLPISRLIQISRMN